MQHIPWSNGKWKLVGFDQVKFISKIILLSKFLSTKNGLSHTNQYYANKGKWPNSTDPGPVWA